jgi:hypothetical protein
MRPTREGDDRRRSKPSTRAVRAAELEQLVAEIGARIRPVCSHMSDGEFDALVLDMARMRLRFRELERRHDH